MPVRAVLRSSRYWFLLLPAILVSGPARGQPDASAPESLKDPQALLAAAAPSYDFNSVTMKPWHFTASYELFDRVGNPADKGTFEYWWASPDVYRGTWKRNDTTWTTWRSGDGKGYFKTSGGDLQFLETEFWRLLLDPLPRREYLSKQLKRDTITFGKTKLPCVRTGNQSGQETPEGTYCFDPRVPALVMMKGEDGITVGYGEFALVERRQLAKSVVESVEGRRILTMTVESIGGLNPADPVLIPPPDAQTDKLGILDRHSQVVPGQLVKRFIPPSYQGNHLSGTLILDLKIGTDGKVKGVQVVSGPPSPLVDAMVKNVSEMEYSPFRRNGEPVEVRILMTFTAGAAM